MIRFCLILFVACGFARAQYTPERYIEKYGRLADSVSAVYGVPAAIILAQGMLESGYGASNLARLKNNHFGIRYTNRYGIVVYRRFCTVEDCFVSHSVMLSSLTRYSGLFDIPLADYRAWAYGLQACGYATDERYAEKLIWIIERYIF